MRIGRDWKNPAQTQLPFVCSAVGNSLFLISLCNHNQCYDQGNSTVMLMLKLSY